MKLATDLRSAETEEEKMSRQLALANAQFKAQKEVRKILERALDATKAEIS